MSGSISVEPDANFTPGRGVVRLVGAGRFTGPAEISIKRGDYDQGVLGKNGWQVADELLTPDGVSIDGNDLLLQIGPSIVQRVVSGMYQVAVPAAGFEASVFWPDLPLQTDEALNMIAEPARGDAQAASPVRPIIHRPEAVATVAPVPAITAKPQIGTATGPDARITSQPVDPKAAGPVAGKLRRWWPIWLALLAVVLIGAGGYAVYWMTHPEPEPAPVSPAAGPEHQPSQAPAPANGIDLTQMSVADALRSGATGEALLREAQRRLQLDEGQRGDALLLMRGAANPDLNYPPANAALGRLYDPTQSHPAGVRTDARQAAAQYQVAIRGGDNSVAAERDALKSYLENQAQHGDVFAPLILKEFWP